MMIFNKILGAFFLYSLLALSETQARISPGEGNMLKISSSLNNEKTLSYLLEEGSDQIAISLKKNYGTHPDPSSLDPYIQRARSSLISYTNYGRPILSPPPAPGSHGPPGPRPYYYIIDSNPMISSEYQSSSDKIPANGAITFKPMPPQIPSAKAGLPYGPDDI